MQAESAVNTIGSRLRRLLRLRRQSIRDFSELTGVPYRTLQDYLGDKAKPGAEQLARIAAAGVDINFVLTGKARRWGYLIQDAAPADDESYYILADQEVVEAIDRKAREVITKLLSDHLNPGDALTFDALLNTYMQLFSALADIFARSNPPIEDARKAGLSIGGLIDSVLDVAGQVVATKFLSRSGTSLSQGK